MVSSMLDDAAYTTYPLDDFVSILRMIRDEFMKMVLATVTLFLVLLSMVNIIGRLSECALNVAIREEPKTCPLQLTGFKTLYNNRWLRTAFAAIFSILLVCVYVNTVVCPVYLLVAGPVLSLVQLGVSCVASVLAICVSWGKMFL